MTAERPTLSQRLRQVVLAQEGGPTDGELMERFTARRDAAALEALIRRHGPMVLAVCRRVLGNEPDAEDAFQAAFLVFVRKAASVRARELVGAWLYGVAYRTAMKARGAAVRRRVQERRAAIMNPTRAEPEEEWAELLPLLDRELNRLPDKYRTAVVLCELEGRPRKEAARKLGVPEGTLSSRLATAKRMLARRLGRHGAAPSGCVLAAALARGAGVPPPLLASTAKAASLFAVGQAATAVVSARVAALAEGVLKTMLLTKLTVGLLAAAVVVASGAMTFACGNRGASPASPPAAASTAAAAPNKEKPEAKKDQPEWGDAVNGVQARLRASKTAWDVGETPEFVLDVRNQGQKTPNQCRVPNFCEMEWDGQWYRHDDKGDLDCKSTSLQPGKEIDEWVKLSLDMPWVRKGDKDTHLLVTAGKHTLRAELVLNDGSVPGWIYAVSQPVEVEVGKESAWGEAVGGVQARLRTPKAVWRADEAPTFILDLRTVGKATAEALHAYANLEIEVDGAWYWDANEAHRRGKVYLDTDVIPEHANNWLTVTPDKDWALKAPAAGKPEHFPLPPGKHTIRVSYALAYGKGRPVSGPIEIQVGEESAWGDADGGVQARLRTPRAVWNTGEAPTFILDLRLVGKKPVDALKFKTELEIEVDGAWYADANESDRLTKQFLATDRLDRVEKTIDWLTVAADKDWQIKTPAAGKPDRFPLPPGKHTIRLSYAVTAGGKTYRPVSGPVEMEIEADRESAWGDAVDGVQARVRTPKKVWGPDETPTFHLDLRNQGKKTWNARRVPYDCQIEVDGTWYAFDKPSGPSPAVGDLLEPGMQIDDWATVSPDKNWGSSAGKMLHFPLAPGKYTVRVTYPLNGVNKSPLRPLSGPVEIEVGKETNGQGAATPAVPDDKQTAARRAVDIRKKLDVRIDYELLVPTTLDKALDELLIRQGIPWKVNTPAFVKQGRVGDFIRKDEVLRIDKLTAVFRRQVLEALLSNVVAKSEDGEAVYVIRPEGVEITTRRAYLDEFFPGRKVANLPPLVYAVFDKVPLQDAVTELGRTTGCTIVLGGHPGKEGETKVTAELTGVPLDTALALLADMADLKFVHLGNVYYVASPDRARQLEMEERERNSPEDKGKAGPTKPPEKPGGGDQ